MVTNDLNFGSKHKNVLPVKPTLKKEKTQKNKSPKSLGFGEGCFKPLAFPSFGQTGSHSPPDAIGDSDPRGWNRLPEVLTKSFSKCPKLSGTKSKDLEEGIRKGFLDDTISPGTFLSNNWSLTFFLEINIPFIVLVSFSFWRG